MMLHTEICRDMQLVHFYILFVYIKYSDKY